MQDATIDREWKKIPSRFPLTYQEESSFHLVCVEDVKRDEVPLIFGRLGILPSALIQGVGAAVSVQRNGRLWRCVAGKDLDVKGC